jgi:hypothetical protein
MNADPAPNCSFTLDDGKPCRTPARHGSPFCRHHEPEVRARRRSAVSSPSPGNSAPTTPDISADSDESNPWSLRAYWRVHHRLIPGYNAHSLDDCFDMILDALAEREIGPRSAGRLLLAIFDRRRALAAEMQEASLSALRRQVPNRQPAAPLFEALRNYPVSNSRVPKTSTEHL